MGFPFTKKKKTKDDAHVLPAATAAHDHGAIASPEATRRNPPNKGRKKVVVGSPDTAATEASVATTMLDSLNVKHVAQDSATAADNDFEVFMGEYPEEEMQQDQDSVRKQLFHEDEVEVDKGVEEQQIKEKTAPAVENTKKPAAATAAVKDVDDQAENSKTPAAPLEEARPFQRAATIYSQEVFIDGMIQDTDDQTLVSDVGLHVKEATDDKEAASRQASTDTTSQETTDESAAQTAAVAEAITTNLPKATLLNKPSVPPQVPTELHPHREVSTPRVRSAAEIAAIAEAIAGATISPTVSRYNMDDNDEEKSYNQASLKQDATWTTAGSTARDTYEPSATSTFLNSQAVGGKKKSTARKVLDALGCTTDTTIPEQCDRPFQVSDLFYDPVCSPDFSGSEKLQPGRPYFNEDFAKQFLQTLMTKGISVLYLQPPATVGNDSLDWKGRTVSLMIEPGISGNETAIQPKLEWTTLAGGRNFEVETASLALLRILSISSSAEAMREDGDNDQDLCFFTVTSDIGDVHIFEASTPEERDLIVNGLKNVIARLTFHLIAGDTTASSELYGESKSDTTGELPSLANSTQTMNRIAHTLLA